MSQNSPADKVEGARAEIVAIQLVQNVGSPVPETGVPLGCEAELCAEHVIAHRTLRETLGILDDLGMLQTKRGRGGGYWLKRPAPIGIIRRLFALLASRGTQSSYAEGVIWILGIANLQLAFRRMEALNSNLRAEWCDRLAAVLCGSTGLRRWVLFQKELTRVADDLFLSTMKSSMLAYLGRIGPVSPYYDKFDKHLLEVEKAMLQALRDGHSSEAERQLRIGHAYISRGPVFECLA